MFEGASAFVPTLGCWDVAALVAYDAMFVGTRHEGVCTAQNASPAGCTCGGCTTSAETEFPKAVVYVLAALILVVVLGLIAWKKRYSSRKTIVFSLDYTQDPTSITRRWF